MVSILPQLPNKTFPAIPHSVRASVRLKMLRGGL